LAGKEDEEDEDDEEAEDGDEASDQLGDVRQVSRPPMSRLIFVPSSL
jgi:hypothetical protein